MLYRAENSITPKLKLSDIERNESLSCILKFRFPGNWRTIMSTQMTEAPRMHAIPLRMVMTHPRSSLDSTMAISMSRVVYAVESNYCMGDNSVGPCAMAMLISLVACPDDAFLEITEKF